MATKKDQYDSTEGYCRKLGHHLTFKYCREVQDKLPCPKIRDCWFERFDINAFLQENYTPEELAKIDAPPKDKMTSLIELIKKARDENK